MGNESTTRFKHASPSISVIMRSRNDIGVIADTLDGLRRQTRSDYELIVLDNDSTDGTREAYLARGFEPNRVPAGTYNPGRVLNAGVRRASGQIVVFLNSDCIPTHADMLERLVAPLERDEADAVYARQSARPDANALVRRDHAKAFGDRAPEFGGLFFSLAVSAFPRALLIERPLPENVQYSEDLYWAVQAQRDGLRIRYVADAEVYHSHNYTIQEYAKRFFEEGRADARIFAEQVRPLRPVRTAVGLAKDVLFDVGECARSRDLPSLLRSPIVRAVQRMGYIAGRLAGPRRDLSA